MPSIVAAHFAVAVTVLPVGLLPHARPVDLTPSVRRHCAQPSYYIFYAWLLARPLLLLILMNTQKGSTVVGVFEDRLHANKAITELHEAGFTDKHIGVAMKHDEGVADDAGKDSHAGSGALTGALTGLGLGALAGLGVLAGVIPVVGPAIAAGTLGVVLSNAAAGAGIAGLVGALVGAGMPEHEAKYYQGEFEAGRTIVTVNADGRSDEVRDILRECGGYDQTSRGAAMQTA